MHNCCFFVSLAYFTKKYPSIVNMNSNFVVFIVLLMLIFFPNSTFFYKKNHFVFFWFVKKRQLMLLSFFYIFSASPQFEVLRVRSCSVIRCLLITSDSGHMPCLSQSLRHSGYKVRKWWCIGPSLHERCASLPLIYFSFQLTYVCNVFTFMKSP